MQGPFCGMFSLRSYCEGTILWFLVTILPRRPILCNSLLTILLRRSILLTALVMILLRRSILCNTVVTILLRRSILWTAVVNALAIFFNVIATALSAQVYVTLFSGHYGQQLGLESRTCKIHGTLEDSSFVQIRIRL